MTAATVGRARSADAELRTLLRGAWSSLPALLLGSVVLCLAGAVVVFAAPGLNAVSIVLAAVLVAPAFGALTATVDIIAHDDEPGLRDWWRMLRAVGPLALRTAVVPAGCAELFAAALAVWDGGRRPLALPSLGLTGAAALLALVLWMTAIAIARRHTDVRGAARWLLAARLIAARPVRFTAVYCLAALGMGLAVAWSASLLLLVPAPVALVLVGAVRTTSAEIDGRSS